MTNEDFRFWMGVFITFCMTSFLWILIGDYFISSLYCVVNNTFTGEYNKTPFHYPSMIVNYNKNMTNTYRGWFNDSYKEKYLNNSELINFK